MKSKGVPMRLVTYLQMDRIPIITLTNFSSM
nr:MAG TPA: hypothetical protein [Caudoviricetes sp.]